MVLGLEDKLGESIGLIYVHREGEEIRATDGVKVKILANERGYKAVFFDGKKLYYSKGNSLFTLPENKKVETFDDARNIDILSIEKMDGQIIVGLGRIGHYGRVKLVGGTIIDEGWWVPQQMCVRQKDVYITDPGKGVIIADMHNYQVLCTFLAFKTEGAGGITMINDKLYFSRENELHHLTSAGIPRTNGRGEEESNVVAKFDFPISVIHGVSDYRTGFMYIGSRMKKGIAIVPYFCAKVAKTILGEEAAYVSSITSAPLEFMKQL